MAAKVAGAEELMHPRWIDSQRSDQAALEPSHLPQRSHIAQSVTGAFANGWLNEDDQARSL
jgi:hypothetical protein